MAGNSLDFGASNNGTCRSRSTRSLFSRHRRRRLDARRRPTGDFLLLVAHHLLTRLLALLAERELPPLVDLGARPIDALQDPRAELVHDVEP